MRPAFLLCSFVALGAGHAHAASETAGLKLSTTLSPLRETPADRPEPPAHRGRQAEPGTNPRAGVLSLNLAYNVGQRIGALVDSARSGIHMPRVALLEEAPVGPQPSGRAPGEIPGREAQFMPGLMLGELGMTYLRLGRNTPPRQNTAAAGGVEHSHHGHGVGIGLTHFAGNGSRLFGTLEFNQTIYRSNQPQLNGLVFESGRVRSTTVGVGLRYAF